MLHFRPDRARLTHEIGATVRLALPLIAAQLAAAGPNLLDALLAGHLSAHVQAAVTTAVSIWVLPLVAGIGMMMAVSPSVAQLDGAGRRHEAGAVLMQALWLAWGMGVVMWFLIRHASPLMGWVGVVPTVRADVSRFLMAISWAAPAMTSYFALRGFSEGLSLTRPSMYFSFGGLLLLGPLGYVLMYGKFGLPPLGSLGSGIATGLMLWVEMAAFAFFISRHPAYRDTGVRTLWAWPKPPMLWELFKVGAPVAVTLLAEAGLFVGVALAIARLGEKIVASHQVALSVAQITFMVPLGLSMATTVRVGNAVGRDDGAGVRYAGLCGIGLAVCTASLSSLLMLTMPRWIASLYSNDATVVTLAAQLMALAGLFQFSDGIQVTSNGALRGLKDTRVSMVITLFAYWGVGMPVGWWLAMHQGLGARGMWMGLVAGLSVSAVLLFTRFWRNAAHEKWRHGIGVEPDAASMTGAP